MMANLIWHNFFLNWSFLVLLLIKLLKVDGKFSYEDQDIWHNEFPQCGGKLQSPINIKSSTAIIDEHLKLKFSRYDEPFNSYGYYWINDGHTLKLVKQTYIDSHLLSGSAVENGRFKFKQLHLHWGERNDIGSEHSVDGIRYPLEVHLVHENVDFIYHPSPNKLVVLAVFFVVGKENPFFKGLVNRIHDLAIENKRLSVSPRGDHGLINLLPDNLESYFVYNGSLTTPLCNETVRWIIFKHIEEVSEEQLNAIRSLFRFSSNSRHTQQYNSRFVFTSDLLPMEKSLPTHPSSSKSRFSFFSRIFTIIIIVALLIYIKIC